jgi:hypothetical protein
MGTLDDAIREHLELKRRTGAAEDEVQRLESEAFGSARREPPAPVIDPPVDQPSVEELPPPPEAVTRVEPVAPAEPVEPVEPVAAPEPVAPAEVIAPVASDTWLDDEDAEPELPSATDQSTSEFTAHEATDAAGGAPASDYVAPDDEGEDLLEETPDFLQETPEHDRLWFEQKPPRDFDFD